MPALDFILQCTTADLPRPGEEYCQCDWDDMKLTEGWSKVIGTGKPRKELIVDSTDRQGRAADLETRSAGSALEHVAWTNFLEQSADMMCVAGMDGYFQWLNPAWTSRLGWTVDELTAKPFLEFVHAEDRKITMAEMDRLAAGPQTVLFENRCLHKNGTYCWFQWNARSSIEDGLIYATARDVTQTKWLEEALIRIADWEKEHLGRELHDGLCQSLAGIAALGSTLSRNLAKGAEPDLSAAAAEISELLNEVIDEARSVCHGLAPALLKEASLGRLLEILALNTEHQFDVSCVVTCDGQEGDFSDQMTLHLFRITQEALHNALTHGHAERIDINLVHNEGRGVLSIRDNGVGISEEECDAGGIGLHSMAFRAHLMAGSLKVRRRNEAGTAVICTFPWPGVCDCGDESI